MGKSGGRKKKTPSSHSTSPSSNPPLNASVNASAPTPIDPSILLIRAHELKEQGNRLFQSKDYPSALHHYDLALKLTPKNHPDRAVFHSNRAACLMQIKPVNHELVATECSLALEAQPLFPRALLRRARALEALKRYELAAKDVQMLLTVDEGNKDATELMRRLRGVGGNLGLGSECVTSRPSPAALGASAVVAGLGPSLPSRPITKKQQGGNGGGGSKVGGGNVCAVLNKDVVSSQPKLVVPSGENAKSVLNKEVVIEDLKVVQETRNKKMMIKKKGEIEGLVRHRPLKLVYDHDIRLGQMPEKCSFRVLREIVAKRFPSSKSVLIKYKDSDGDLVTITGTEELRLAESGLKQPVPIETGNEEKKALPLMRFHIVEVSPDQEPPLTEEELRELPELELESEPESEDKPEQETLSVNETESPNKDHKKSCGHAECKEVEMDDWLLHFAELFRTQVGIDPDAHVDLHELGMELCAEALETTVTSEEAQVLFQQAASKFQEVAALALFNWGNVHMCAARKRIPLDENAPKDEVRDQLRVAYDWVRERYSLAGSKYEEALVIKPDFYEGLLALGQQHFEMAKLHWSFAIADKVDLVNWEFKETMDLFDSAEVKMKEATEMWEKAEEKRNLELKDPSKKDEVLKKKKREMIEVSSEEAAEQAAVMRQQIHLFWGNLLFERSQVEFKLGFEGWKKNLDDSIKRFKLAGASEEDINVVLKNHGSNADLANDDVAVEGKSGDVAN